MVEYQHDLLIIYTSKNGRTGAMAEPIVQGMHDGGASTLVVPLKRCSGRTCWPPRE
jgi:menaquinone-dependent protoporphyrinogen IX oxidase